MLVLTRKQQEQIRIGNDITIKVIRVKGKYVQLGISAPRSTRVVRGELNLFDTEKDDASLSAPNCDRNAEEFAAGVAESPHQPKRRTSLPDRGPLAARISASGKSADSLLAIT